MDFQQTEAEQGVWFTWNKFPRNKADSQQEVIPISALFTPFFNSINEIPQINREHIKCDKCKWYVSNESLFDYSQMAFKCMNCDYIQKLGSHLQKDIQQGVGLEEFQAGFPVYEYVHKNDPQKFKPLLLINLDFCTPESEFQHVKESLIKQIENLHGVYVSFVAFNHNVMIYDLQNPSPFVSVLGGNKNYNAEQILGLLKLKETAHLKFQENQYVQSIENCKEKLLRIIGWLKSNQFHIKNTNRSLRETGLSLIVNTALAMSFGGMGGRMINIVSGPCTRGQGMILEQSLQKTFRTHEEIENSTDLIYIYQKANDFYSSLIPLLNKHFISVDLFAFCLTQFGLSEMRGLIMKTGGLIINDEEFSNEFFHSNFSKYFENILSPHSVYGCSMQIKNSNSLYLQGIIGCCGLKEKISGFAKEGDVFIGEHGGDEYVLNGPLKSSTFLIMFGLTKGILDSSVKNALIQIQIKYFTKEGMSVIRVFNFNREFSNELSIRQNYFDQEAAIVTLAKIAAFKGEKISVTDLLYWLNNQIVWLIKLFSQFTKENISSFKLSPMLEQFPQFMFFFRKSYFVQRIGVSLDEQAFFKLALYRENQSNVLCMIQPAVYQYSLDNERPVPVSCDLEQLKPDCILLVDTYYYLLIWQGKNIHQWVQQGYHLQEDYSYLKGLLEMPDEDAQIILEDRYPQSKLIKCHQGSPMERILKSKLNPNQKTEDNPENENYITDDVSMKRFMDHIVQLIVNQASAKQQEL